MATDKKMSIKLLIDKDHKKVLFAEAGKDFVDFLISLLSLPVGTVVRLLKKGTTVGCISNLYSSLENLNESYVQVNQDKDTLLCPRVTNSSFLLPDIDSQPSHQKKIYRCPNRCNNYVTDNPSNTCASCYNRMAYELQFVGTNNKPSQSNPATASDGEGGYVKGLVTYMVMDDLSVSPMSMISGVALLNKFNVKDFGALEEKMVQLGINEGLELLKASLLSKAALTEVFLKKKAAPNASPARGGASN